MTVSLYINRLMFSPAIYRIADEPMPPLQTSAGAFSQPSPTLPRQIPSRNNAIFDWCLTNSKTVVFGVSQLLPNGTSDHNAIVIKSDEDRSERPKNKRMYKRDLRESYSTFFSLTTTSVDWTEIYVTPDDNLKYKRFNELISAVMNYFKRN